MNQSQKDAMQAGRERAREKRRVAAVERIECFELWTKTDAGITAKRNAGVDAVRVPMPELPTSADYRLARGEDDEA